jgi:hypothetical protein
VRLRQDHFARVPRSLHPASVELAPFPYPNFRALPSVTDYVSAARPHAELLERDADGFAHPVALKVGEDAMEILHGCSLV